MVHNSGGRQTTRTTTRHAPVPTHCAVRAPALTRPGVEPAEAPTARVILTMLTIYHRREHGGDNNDDNQRRELLHRRVACDGERARAREGVFAWPIRARCENQHTLQRSKHALALVILQKPQRKHAKRRKLDCLVCETGRNSIAHGVEMEMDAACWLFSALG